MGPLGGPLPVPELGQWPQMVRCRAEVGWEGSLEASDVYMTQCAKVTYCGCIIF